MNTICEDYQAGYIKGHTQGLADGHKLCEDAVRTALRGHPDSELFGEAGLLAATMRCVDAMQATNGLSIGTLANVSMTLAETTRTLAERTSSLLTPEERALVLGLLKLYDAAYDHASWHDERCSHGCEFCEAFEQAGEHSSLIFTSLKAKVEATP